MGLDRFGRVVDQRWIKTSTGTDLERIQYTFDAAGNRTLRHNLVASSAQDEGYTYDGLSELTRLQRGTLSGGVITSVVWQEDFTFDPTGNWNNYVTTSLTQSRTHNKANEITQINGSSSLIAQNAAGNITKTPKPSDWSTAYDLTYDAWNRLVKVMDGASTVATYAYDGQNRRTTKTAGGSTRHYYYSNQWQVLEERVGASTSADRQFVWGLRYIDDLILRDRGSERYYALHDFFNCTAIVDTFGAIKERYGYDAFGGVRFMTPAFGSQGSSLVDWETLYGAYRWDSESGFYQARNRYLHPKLGRWLSRDPIGYKGGLNLYAYVADKAVNKVDPLGLQIEMLEPLEPFIRVLPDPETIIRVLPNPAETPIDVPAPPLPPPVPLMGPPQMVPPIKVPVSIPLPPLNTPNNAPPCAVRTCPKSRLEELTNLVEQTCKSEKVKCTAAMDYWQLLVQKDATIECIKARTRRERECWGGGDRNHINTIENYKRGLKECDRLINRKKANASRQVIV